MAVTRIKNNQITDSVINAAAKLQDFTVTGGKLANALTYGSDLTITGNLTVSGNVTAVDTVDLVVEDPIIVLAQNQTGVPSVDIGYIGRRGTSNNIAFVWDESQGTFVTAFTTDLITNTTISINSYASMKSLDSAVTGNLIVTGTSGFTGNATVANIFVTSGKFIDVGNNLIGNVQSPVANSDAATKGYVDSQTSSGFTIQDDTANTTVVSGGDTLVLNGTANEIDVDITGADTITFGLPDNVTVTGNLSAGNLSGTSIVGTLTTAAQTNITSLGTLTSLSITGNVLAGNLNSNAAVTGVSITASGNVLAGNVNSNAAVTGVSITASGNVLAGNVNSNAAVTGVSITASGNVLAGNVNSNAAVTGVSITASGNVLAGNVNSNAAVTGVTATFSGNVTAGNLNSNAAVTGLTVTATGNVNGGNVNTSSVNSSSALTITTTTGNINLEPSGNIVLNNKYINGLTQPVQDNDAASKIYVDNMVSTQLAYHQAVAAATVGNLAAATGGAITYNNGTAGVGATLTTTGTFTLIDTANIAVASTRILVKNQADATQNGIYEYTSATVITRTTDADTYGPNSSTDLSVNDYFFVTGGSVNAGSAYILDAPSGVITFGTSNITFAQFSSSQTYSAGNGISINGTVLSAKVDNNTTAFDAGGNIIVKTGANLTTPNIGDATGNSLTLSGNGLLSATTVSVSGNVTGGNLNSNAAVTGVTVTASGNLEGNNATITNGVYAATVTTTGNVLAGNLNSNAAVTGVSITASGNVLAGNVNSNAAVTGVSITASGNVLAGNLNSNAAVTGVTGVFSGNVDAGNVNVTTALNVPSLTVTGNVTAGNLNSNAAVTGVTVTASGNLAGNNATITNTLTAANANIGNANITTQLTAANITSASGLSITTASNGNITLDPNGSGVIILTDETANRMLFTGSNKEINTDANATFDGANLVITGSLQVDNVIVNGADITSNTSELTINGALADVDFRVAGDTVANLVLVDAGTDTVLVNTGTATTGATLKVGGNKSLMIPVGTTGDRPTGVTGMVRFNTSVNNLEFYDNDSWETAGSQFTVIAANTQSGNGSQVAFNLPQTGTTAGTIVSINGVVQIPVTAYAVSGNVCTFTEAPESTDVIDFRQLTTTSEVTAIAGAGGGMVEADAVAANVVVTGNLIVSSPGVFYGDGSGLTNLSVSGDAIINGTSNMTVVSSGGNIRANVAGTTVQTISAGLVAITGDLSVSGNATLSGNILGDRVQNGTTSFDIQTASGNANITVGGISNVTVFSTAGANITGTLGVSGNITGNYILGNGSQLTGIDATSIQSGTSAVSVISSGGNIRANVAGATVQTLSTAGANVTGYITASGNVTGSYILGNGSLLTGIDATSIQNGSANVRTFLNGNATVSAAGTANVLVVTSTGANIAGTLNTGTGNANVGNIGATNVVATNLTGTLQTAAQTNVTSVGTLTSLAVTGNITSGNLQGTSIVGTLTTAAQTNITSVGALNAGSITSGFGAIDIGTDNITVGGIINANGNGTGNIGSSSVYFNTVFAKATSAQYADLAEKYVADAEYAPGTVLAFGGNAEVTLSTEAGSTRVAGVVSTNPSYIMNAGLTGEHVAMVALQGRVPCRVVGPVSKGDMMVAAGNGYAKVDNNARAGTIIGKALENFAGAEGTIEVVIGRN